MAPDAASTDAMRAFWNARARENAMWFIHSNLDFAHTDEAEFWASGEENLDSTLAVFGLTIGPTDDVVEIGCGIGRITRAIAARARHVVGVDVSDEMVERGRRQLADLGNVDLRVGNGHDLAGIEDETADVVYSFIVFQHIPDPAVTCRYVTDMGRVLRPNGWALFQISDLPAMHERRTHAADRRLVARIRRALGRAPKGVDRPQWLGSAVDRDDLRRALAEGGLELAGIAGEGTQFCFVHAIRV